MGTVTIFYITETCYRMNATPRAPSVHTAKYQSVRRYIGSATITAYCSHAK